MHSKELTRAEEEIMHFLWERDRAFVKDLVEDFPEPKPAYNTVSTIVRILENKGFVGHEALGRTHRYYPLITKEDYSRSSIKKLVGSYFSGSYKKMLSFFVQEENISLQELEKIIKEINKE